MADRPRKNKTAPRNIQAARNRAKAMELREMGYKYIEIAAKMGLSVSYSHKMVKTAIELLSKEPAERVRTIELQRLDVALKAIMPKVKKGNFQAIDRMIALQARRTKYLALDAPKAQHIQVETVESIQDQFGDRSVAENEYYAEHGCWPDEAPATAKETEDHLSGLH